MPLSEHEQRLLDEMERNLYGRDADVVSARGDRLRPNYRFVTIGVILVAIGIAVMIGGVSSQLILVGILGFVLVFLGVMLASRPSTAPAAPAAESSSKPRTPRRAGFMQRMEQQWNDRQDGRS